MHTVLELNWCGIIFEIEIACVEKN